MARLNRRSNHDVQRGALNAANRAGLSLEEWMEQVGDIPSSQGAAGPRSPDVQQHVRAASRNHTAPRDQKTGDIRDLAHRLESLSSRLDKLSETAQSGAMRGRDDGPGQAPGRRPRRSRSAHDHGYDTVGRDYDDPTDDYGDVGFDDQFAQAQPAAHQRSHTNSASRPARPSQDRSGHPDRDRRTGSMLDILNTLDERVSAMAERIQGAGNHSSTHAHSQTDGNPDVDLKSAVSEIARRQRQLDRKTDPGRSARSAPPRDTMMDGPSDSMRNGAMEAHFSDLASRIDALRNQSDDGPIVDLRNEVSALRSELSSQSRGPDRQEDFAQIQNIVRNLETSISDNPGKSSIDDVRNEIADLRQTLLSNDTHSDVAALREGYETILARLEGLQSTVGDPQLYHSIADRLGDVRKALRALPQVEHASGMERRISALASQLELVGTQVSGLPFDSLQNQVFEMQGALQAINPENAIKDLDWKLRALADKIDTLEDGLSDSNTVSERVASLESLIRSQPSPAAMVGRLDELQELFLEKSSHDAVRDLEHRIATIGDKLDFIGTNTNPQDMLAALDGRVVDLCARFDRFSTSFEDFADTQNGDVLNPQIEKVAARIESLAEAMMDGKTIEPVRRDISELRMQLADGDRAVVDLAERIGRISDRLDRFTVFDGEDGKLGRLSDDLIQLQQQIADGDSVVFEILKRVGSLEKLLSQPANGSSGDTHGLAKEIEEIRDRLASGDETLTNIANRMESLLSSVNVVASEPGFLSELEPVQNDFAALQSELSEGNRVAREVLGGLSAIDARLNNLAEERAESSDIARLSDEIATLRDVVQATDDATVSSLNAQISSLADRLDQAPVQGAGDAVFHQLEQQIAQMAAKLEATEGQLVNLSAVSDKLDRIDDMLQGSQQATLSATQDALERFASSASRGSAADDPAVVALQSDLQRLQNSASKTDDSFGAVQDALTGIADRLSSLETSQAASPEASVPPPKQARTTDQPQVSTRRKQAVAQPVPGDLNPVDPNPVNIELNLDDPAVSLADSQANPVPAPEDNRPLEPGSGKPRPSRKKVIAPAQRTAPATQQGKPLNPRAKTPGNRAEFLAAARAAARQTAAETGAKAISDEEKPKRGWLARAASLRNRKSGKDKPETDRQEPQMPDAAVQPARVSVLDDEISQVSEKTARKGSPVRQAMLEDTEAEIGAPSPIKKHAKSIVIGIVTIAVIVGGIQVFNTYMGDGFNVGALTGNTPSATTSETPEDGSAPVQSETLPVAPAINPVSSDGSTSDTSTAFSPPSGLESSFGDKPTDPTSGSLTQPSTAPRQIPVGSSQDTPFVPVPDTAQASVVPAQTDIAALPATPSPSQNLPDEDAGPIALREAAANGDTFAQFEIASRYMEGRSATQNLPKAVEWYSKAAGKGFAQAQYRLGSMFEKGLGIPKDLQSARSWYTRAADKGNAKAIHNLAVLHAEGGLGERNFNRAAQWFIQAANYGVTDSQYNLGILYAQGLGVERNMSESYKWFSLAAKAGDSDAGRKRDAIALELDEEQKSRARVSVSAWKPEPIDPAANSLPAIPAEWQGPGRTAASSNAATGNQAAGISAPNQDLSGALSTQAMIGQAQELLARRGFQPGPADGKTGPQTRNAVKAFQRSTGLPETGIIDISLLNALGGESI